MQKQKKTLRALFVLAAVASLPACSGCSILATAFWVVNPNDVDAEFAELVGKRVAVVCRPDSSIAYQHHDVPQLLAEGVNMLLKRNVEEIDVVSQADINDWTDQNELTEFQELGTAMQADAVVSMELVDFHVRQGRTMLQGFATVEVAVHDVKSGDILYRLGTIESKYPPNSGVPADISDNRSENRFRQRFLRVLSDQIARRFYAHDSRTAVKIDRFYNE